MTIQKKISSLINNKPKGGVTNLEDLGINTKHQHVWKVIGKTYAPPSSMGGNVPPEVLERMAFGVTTLLWECACGETKKEELLGNDEDLLESLINKVDKIGPQTVERNGKTYVLAEWKPPVQNPNMIPIK